MGGSFHIAGSTGNLLVLPDGKVGFIDFGIVGRISPTTWKAIEALLASVNSEDYTTMAKALATMGATDEAVNIEAFGRDLKSLFDEIKQLDPELVVDNRQSGSPVSFPFMHVECPLFLRSYC